jgi:hypothetical protein
LGSLGRADPARLWGIGLMATLIAGLAYTLFAVIGSRVIGASRAVTVPAPPPARRKTNEPRVRALAIGLASTVLPLALGGC